MIARTVSEQHQIENDEQLTNHLSERGLDADAPHWQLELPARIKQRSRECFTRLSARLQNNSTEWCTAC